MFPRAAPSGREADDSPQEILEPDLGLQSIAQCSPVERAIARPRKAANLHISGFAAIRCFLLMLAKKDWKKITNDTWTVKIVAE